MNKEFAVAINCMDGRAQKPVFEYICKAFGVRYVDMVTEPGPNRILYEGNDEKAIGSLKKRVSISVESHGSRLIAVAGHHDCAGNPENEAVQKEHLRKSVDIIRSWGLPVKRVVALWLGKDFNPGVVVDLRLDTTDTKT